MLAVLVLLFLLPHPTFLLFSVENCLSARRDGLAWRTLVDAHDSYEWCKNLDRAPFGLPCGRQLGSSAHDEDALRRKERAHLPSWSARSRDDSSPVLDQPDIDHGAARCDEASSHVDAAIWDYGRLTLFGGVATTAWPSSADGRCDGRGSDVSPTAGPCRARAGPGEVCVAGGRGTAIGIDVTSGTSSNTNGREGRRQLLVQGELWSGAVSSAGGTRRADMGWHRPTRRFGEAEHPGPSNLPGTAARRYVDETDAAVRYPTPHDRGLNHVVAPGFAARPQAPTPPTVAKEDFRLVLETVNATGWKALRNRLLATEAHVVLAQETWVTQAALPAASAWARRHGWRAVWSPAVVTKRGGVAAGVAVLAKDYLGLRMPAAQPHEVVPARAVAATVETPDARAIHLVSCYLRHGRGADTENARTLAAIGAAVAANGEDEVTVVGGDFNMSPDQLIGTDFDRTAGLTVFHGDLERGTYRTSKSCSTLDYFAVSDRLAAAVDGVAIVEASGVKGHTPVQLHFKPRLAQLKALHLRMPPRLATERVHGPLQPPPEWHAQRALAKAALEAARADAPGTDDVLEAAYAAWADLAEVELERFSGQALKKRGERAKRPRLVWRSVLPERKACATFPSAASLQWLRGIVMEMQRVGRSICEDPADDTGPHETHETAEDDEEAWDACRDDEHDAAREEDGHSADNDSGSPAAPRDCEALRAILVSMRASLDVDVPEGQPTAKFVERLEAVTSIVDRVTAAIEDIDPLDGAPREAAAREEHGHTAEAMQRAEAKIKEMRAEVQQLRDGLDADVAAAISDADAEEARRWKAWLEEDFAAGASRAHAYSRLPQQAVPVAAKVPGGAVSAAPEALLDEQRRKYRELWRPSHKPFVYDWGPADELPLLTAEELRRAAKSFRERTAQTFDGFHPRHLGDLSDGALDALAHILQAMEVCGRWPRQLRLVVTAMLPKPKGGYRPIGILPAPYRLWAKARRAWADRWEAEHARPYLSSAKGNGPLDTLWRMGVRQEAGTAQGDQAAVIADDLAAFFETVDRERLMIEAEALGYPRALLRGALAAYSSARMLTMQGRVAREIHPTVGVVAGCSLAMSLTKLFYLRALDNFAAQLPPTIALDVHVDDITLSAIGPPHAIINDIVAARNSLARVMADLGCRFAADKTAITATTRRLATAVAAALGMATAVTSTPCLLGVDNVAGARRSRLRGQSKKAARLKAALARRSRLGHLRRTLGTKVGRVFRTGILPAAAYDAPVWGVSDTEVTRLRRLAAVAMSPRARGRSLTMTHIWHGLPTAEVEVSPVLQYSKMVWLAVTRRDDATARQCSLADIRRMWEAASANFAPLAERALNERREDGTLEPKTAKAIWGQVRGPIAAAAVSLARVGWRFSGAFELEDARGTTHTLTSSSPALVKSFLRDAVRDAAERKVGHTFAARDASFEGKRACLDLAIAASRPGRKVTRQQSAAFRAVACGAVWTASLAQRRGYATDGLCALCKKARDTIRHRVYECEHTIDAVAAAVPRWFWEEASRTGAHAPFWTTAVMPHPADTAPLPREDLHCLVEFHDDRLRDEATEANRVQVSGRCYLDGSCFPSVIRGLARAACSIVMTDEEGRPRKTLQLPVPRYLPQTSQAAENLVMAAACAFTRGPARLIGDSLSVVRMFSAPAARALAPVRKYAGLMLSTFADPARRRLVVVRWTKAHRAEEEAATPEERIDIRGNAAADAAAKDAITIHPSFDAVTNADIDYYTKRAPHVVTAVTTAMAFFPKAPADMGRAPRPATLEEAKAARRHHWIHSAGTWRCAACDDYVTASAIPRYRLYQRCAGVKFCDAAPTFANQGHVLVKTNGELPITVCTKCGAWGNRRTRKLGRPCAPPTREGEQVVKRVLKGLHPLWRRPQGHATTAREPIAITAAYDPLQGRWRDVQPGHDTSASAPMAEDDRTALPSDREEPPAMPDVEDRQYERDPFDAVMHTLPPAADGDSEEDVFGHGGGLDDPPQSPADARPLDAGPMDVTPTAPQPGTDLVAPPNEPSASTAGGGEGRRRKRSSRDGSRDYVREAVERLGAGLTRRDARAAERLKELRRRVCDRERAAAHGGDADGAARSGPPQAPPHWTEGPGPRLTPPVASGAEGQEPQPEDQSLARERELPGCDLHHRHDHRDNGAARKRQHPDPPPCLPARDERARRQRGGGCPWDRRRVQEPRGPRSTSPVVRGQGGVGVWSSPDSRVNTCPISAPVTEHIAPLPRGPPRDRFVRDQFDGQWRAEMPYLDAVSGAEGPSASSHQRHGLRPSVNSRDQLLAFLRRDRTGGSAAACSSQRGEIRPRSPWSPEPARQVRPRLRGPLCEAQPTQRPEPTLPMQNSAGWVYSAAAEPAVAVSDRPAVHDALAMLNSSVDASVMHDARLFDSNARPDCSAAAPRQAADSGGVVATWGVYSATAAPASAVGDAVSTAADGTASTGRPHAVLPQIPAVVEGHSGGADAYGRAQQRARRRLRGKQTVTEPAERRGKEPPG